MSTENDLALKVGDAFGVPMNLIDGRPWVPTKGEVAEQVFQDDYTREGVEPWWKEEK